MLHEHESNRQRLMKMGQLIFSPDIFTIRRGCVGLARLLLLAICLIVVTSISSTEAKADTLWNKLYSFSDNDFPIQIVPEKSGGSYLVFSTTTYTNRTVPFAFTPTGERIFPSKSKNYIAKLNAAGSVLWHREIDAEQNCIIKCAVSTRQGDLYIAGSRPLSPAMNNQPGATALLVKLSSDGKVKWQKVLGRAGSSEIESMVADDLGNLYVVGDTTSNTIFSPVGTVDTKFVYNHWC